MSDPSSPTYGQWMTRNEVNALIAPAASLRAEVRAWVTSTGAKCVDFPSSLRCTASAGAVNALLQTTLSAFSQLPSGRTVHRLHPDTEYTWPAHLDGKLLFLTNLADFPTARRRNGRMQAIGVDAEGKAAATDYAVLLETLGDFCERPVRARRRRAQTPPPRTHPRLGRRTRSQITPRASRAAPLRRRRRLRFVALHARAPPGP